MFLRAARAAIFATHTIERQSVLLQIKATVGGDAALSRLDLLVDELLDVAAIDAD